MAAPVGLWAVRESFKAAFKVTAKMAAESKSGEKRRSDEDEEFEETKTEGSQEDMQVEDQQ